MDAETPPDGGDNREPEDGDELDNKGTPEMETK